MVKLGKVKWGKGGKYGVSSIAELKRFVKRFPKMGVIKPWILSRIAELKRFIKRFPEIDVIKPWILSRKVVTAMITIALVGVIAGFAATLIPSGNNNVMPHIYGSVIPTNKWANFYSTESMLDGQPLPVGTVVTAYDPQGVVCGEFLVTETGHFGLMPVYADDELTEADEGAVEGDLLEFRINGISATVVDSDEPRWLSIGNLEQIDLTAFTP